MAFVYFGIACSGWHADGDFEPKFLCLCNDLFVDSISWRWHDLMNENLETGWLEFARFMRWRTENLILRTSNKSIQKISSPNNSYQKYRLSWSEKSNQFKFLESTAAWINRTFLNSISSSPSPSPASNPISKPHVSPFQSLQWEKLNCLFLLRNLKGYQQQQRGFGLEANGIPSWKGIIPTHSTTRVVLWDLEPGRI